MVDTRDLKSLGPKRPCGFDSRPRHTVNPQLIHTELVADYYLTFARHLHNRMPTPSSCSVLINSKSGHIE